MKSASTRFLAEKLARILDEEAFENSAGKVEQEVRDHDAEEVESVAIRMRTWIITMLAFLFNGSWALLWGWLSWAVYLPLEGFLIGLLWTLGAAGAEEGSLGRQEWCLEEQCEFRGNNLEGLLAKLELRCFGLLRCFDEWMEGVIADYEVRGGGGGSSCSVAWWWSRSQQCRNNVVWWWSESETVVLVVDVVRIVVLHMVLQEKIMKGPVMSRDTLFFHF